MADMVEPAALDTSTATCRGHRGGVLAVEWEPKAGRLASASLDGSLQLWSPEGQCLEVLEGTERGFASCLAWAAGGSRLATGFQDGAVLIWYPSSALPTVVCKGHKNQVRCVGWRPKGVPWTFAREGPRGARHGHSAQMYATSFYHSTLNCLR
ncbi:unnamed protein product, partial [Effrenium voratum]